MPFRDWFRWATAPTEAPKRPTPAGLRSSISPSHLSRKRPTLQFSYPADFLAVDVETANSDMASICAIGLVHFKAGLEANRLNILINPEDYFDPINISIHGIGPEHVANARTMREAFPAIATALSTAIVVHHTHFDRVALCRAANKYGFSDPTCQWLDSASVARRAWERFSRSGYGLANLASEFGIDFRHHDACEDARAAGLILIEAMSATGLSLTDWLTKVHQPIFGDGGRHAQPGRIDGPLAGEVITFTGRLAMPRRDAAALAAQAGMDIADTVTVDTTILVVGDQDLRHLAGHTKSAKHRKAEQLIQRGSLLRIMGETDFRFLVGLLGNNADTKGHAPSEPNRPAPHRTPQQNHSYDGSLTPEANRSTQLVDAVKAVKREGRLDEAVVLLMDEIDRQGQESRQTGCGVAPWYYEQLAIVYRKLGRNADELVVLERYDRQIKAPGAGPGVLAERLKSVRTRRAE